MTYDNWKATDNNELPSVKRKRGIRVTHVYPLIPTRNHDWSAVYDDYEPSDPIGYGQTPQHAVDDLRNIEEDE